MHRFFLGKIPKGEFLPTRPPLVKRPDPLTEVELAELRKPITIPLHERPYAHAGRPSNAELRLREESRAAANPVRGALPAASTATLPAASDGDAPADGDVPTDGKAPAVDEVPTDGKVPTIGETTSKRPSTYVKIAPVVRKIIHR